MKKAFIAFLILAVLVAGTSLFFVNNNSSSVVNPANDELNEDPDGGLAYALIYNFGEIANLIDNDNEFFDLQHDLALYARMAFPDEFANEETLIGFTFKDGSQADENETVFEGNYYGVEADVTVAVEKFESGASKVSLRNTKNMLDIDGQLRLNGPLTQLKGSLPIDTDYYSIRYLQNPSRVIVTFYQGYSVDSIDEVENKLKELLGEDPSLFDIVYQVNALGTFTLEEIRINQTRFTQGLQ